MFRTHPNRSLAELVNERLLNSYEIRPFPRVVVKLIEAMRNSNVAISVISRIVQSDAAMCAKVLKMANSPLIGAGHRVNRIDHAITILGFNRIKTLAQTHAAAAVITGNGSNIDIRQALWRHSLACATAARVIAQRLDVADEADAFLAGIFHDIGHLFFLDVVPQIYVPLMMEYHPLKLVEQELTHFGVNHQEAGMKFSLAWELPSSTRVAIGYHHRPGKAIAQEEFAWVVHLADHLVHAYKIGSAMDASIMQVDLMRGPFYMTPEIVNGIRVQVIAEFEEFQNMYG